MKLIKLLPAVMLTSIDGSPVSPNPLTHKEFLLSRLSDAEFSKDSDSILILVKLKTLFDYLTEESTGVHLEDSDYLKLCASVRAPSSGGYNPTVAHCLNDFIQSVLKAE